jgi:hypothetical protein
MIDETTAGRDSPVRLEASVSENYSGVTYCACGRRATGIDARRDEPSCRRCANLDLSRVPDADTELVTDGGRDQEEYFVVDEDRSAVVAGPFDDDEKAAADANDRSPGHIVATRGALELLETTSRTTIRWENRDTELVTDGAGESHAGPPGVEQDERGEWTAFEMAAERLDEGGSDA